MSRKKRVLLVSCGGLGNGGVQAIMMGIVRNLSTDFYFDILVFTNEKRYYDDEFYKYGGKILRIPHYEGTGIKMKIDPYIRDNRIYRETRKLLSQELPYDVIHCNKEFESAPILKAAFEYGIPIRICHSHVMHIQGNLLIRVINKIRVLQIYRYSTAQIGCSEDANNSIYVKGSSFKVVPNFYNEDKFKYSEDERSNNGNHIIISQVGAYSANKNQLFSIKITEELIRKGLSVQLNLIGFDLEDAYRKQIDRYVEDNGLSEHINIISGDCDFTLILHKSNCFLMPSMHEGFGISLIEAQAVGLHCFASTNVPVSTNCGGIDFISLDDSPNAWANQILHWFQSTKGIKVRCDTSSFWTQSVMNQYRALYAK